MLRFGKRSQREAPPRGTFDFAWALDEPRQEGDVQVHSVFLRGWIAPPASRTVAGLSVDCGDVIALQPEPRPDVEALFPDTRVLGFRQLIPLTARRAAADWSITVIVDGVPRREPVPLPVALSGDETARFEQAKTEKLARIEPLLRCPRVEPSGGGPCRGTLERRAGGLRCSRCSTAYARTSTHFDLLSDQLVELSAIEETDNISNSHHDDVTRDLIAQFSDGLVLEHGAGLRHDYYENVVNLDVVDYPTTDVRAVGESLPFADDAFDAVISLAVLEHVRDPFRCAREIARIVRPGGKVYVGVAFLAPYHGFPHHYFNMTKQGLAELFSRDFSIERAWTPLNGLPIWALTWFLNRYVAGLPPGAAAHLKEMRVGDLLGPGQGYFDEDFVVELPSALNDELAAVTNILATKTRRSSGVANEPA